MPKVTEIIKIVIGRTKGLPDLKAALLTLMNSHKKCYITTMISLGKT